MAKKFFSLCMVFAMMTVLSLVTSCSKDEETTIITPIEVEVGVKPYNIEGVKIQEKTLEIMYDAYVKSVNEAKGTEPDKMANTVKANLKKNLDENVPASDLETLRKSEVYFLIQVVNKADGKTVSEAKLYGSEL